MILISPYRQYNYQEFRIPFENSPQLLVNFGDVEVFCTPFWTISEEIHKILFQNIRILQRGMAVKVIITKRQPVLVLEGGS